MRRFLVHPTFLATFVILVVVLLVAGVRANESRQRLVAFDGDAGPFEIFVSMPFEPEAFHLAKLQGAGRIAGVDGSRVHLRGVKPEQLRQLSWKPWITGFDAVAPNEQL